MKTWHATPKLMVSIVVCNNNISIFIVIIVIIFMLFIWRIFVLSITKTIQKWCQNKGFQPLPLGCPPSQKWMNFWGEKTKGGRLNFWCKKSFQILHIIDRNIGHEFATKNSEKKARGWISYFFLLQLYSWRREMVPYPPQKIGAQCPLLTHQGLTLT